MLSVIRKNIINRLNILFKDYEEFSFLCDFYDNDIDIIISKISSIVKYAFITRWTSENIRTFIYNMRDEKNIDDLYLKYKKENKRIEFIFNKSKYEFPIELDKDIRIIDLEDIELPSKEKIGEVCNNNIKKRNALKKKQQELDNYFDLYRGFNEIGMTYSRYENVIIDFKKFIYYYAGTSGDVWKDCNNLYNDDRYGGNFKSTSPFYGDFHKNVKKIKESRDIILKKIGKVYEIENGRHRILYILNSGREIKLLVKLERRIEDREFNTLLVKLKEKYKIIVYKNNILNDDANVFIIYNGFIYEIDGKENLKTFYNNLENNISNDLFKVCECDIKGKLQNAKEVNKYKLFLMNEYLKKGKSVIDCNFTDLIRQYDDVDGYLFYYAFENMQSSYQEALILEKDFRKKCIIDCNVESLETEYANDRNVRSRRK